MHILEDKRFDLDQFREKWRNARLSALGASDYAVADEMKVLSELSEDAFEKSLRRVFDNSRQFGLSLSKYFSLTLELSDFSALLPQSGIPCFSLSWRSHNDAYVLSRPGCHLYATISARACDYWREAVDGFVTGAGDRERLSRHRSMGHGDGDCVDILYLEDFIVPRVVSGGLLQPEGALVQKRYGPLPEEIKAAADQVGKVLPNGKARLILDGYSEGTLFYRIASDEGVLCGPGYNLLNQVVEREFLRLLPALKFQDTSPLAVYGGAS